MARSRKSPRTSDGSEKKSKPKPIGDGIVGLSKPKPRGCVLCERPGAVGSTKHHLIPKARHSKRAKKKYGDDCKKRVAWLCMACHRQTHYLFTNTQLEKEYNTLELLSAHEDMAKYLTWIRKKPGDFVPSKGKRKT